MHLKLTPSFGRRKARKLRETSQRAYEDILPRVRIEDPQEIFKNNTTRADSSSRAPLGSVVIQKSQEELDCSVPPLCGGPRNDDLSKQNDTSQKIFSEIWLEIGFGGGEHLLEQIAQNPEIAMVGCEPFMNGVAKLLTHLAPEDYDRVRIWHEDVRYLLDHIPPTTFARAFILFPDPWPKKRHHPRRLITHEFMEKLLPALKEGALLHVASDDAPYVEQIQDVLYDHPALTRLEGPPSADPATWMPRPEGWPMTRYEQKAVTQGKKCAYMRFQKKEKR